jgi:hypothetical protein
MPTPNPTPRNPRHDTPHIAELLETLTTELIENLEDTSQLLFCGSNGHKIVTLFHHDKKALNGSSGPILLPSAHPLIILAAYSNEYINEKAFECREKYGPAEVEAKWAQYLTGLGTEVAEHAETHPLPTWDWDPLLDS